MAGLREKPIFIGIAALLFPAAYRSPKRFVPIAAITSLARAFLHIYYVSGQAHIREALVFVLLWCAIWSTANLIVFYRTRSLVPLIVGHGMIDVVAISLSDGWKLTGVLPTVVEVAELGVIGGIAVGVLIFVGNRLRGAVQRRSAAAV